eukprot:6207323-Lingulodinium_polyedra.AAC.1
MLKYHIARAHGMPEGERNAVDATLQRDQLIPDDAGLTLKTPLSGKRTLHATTPTPTTHTRSF